MSLFEPEILFSIAGIPVTNTLITTILTDILLITLIFKVKKSLSAYPKKLQNIFEIFIEYTYSLTQQIADKRAKSIFPWFASFFIFIFFSNILGLLPGVGTIGFFHHEQGKETFLPLFRPSTSDFNTTFALATVSLVATHALSIKYNGVSNYLKRFFSFNPILLFVGFLEIVSEITKLLSLSFRLFGNIFAGEVVLHTISSLFAFLAPIPFLLLEIIVSFVQASVFAMLTMVFMAILTTPHKEGVH